jgi:hypothetical protein
MKQVEFKEKDMKEKKELCGVCGNGVEADEDGREWTQCEEKDCSQWFHCDCKGVDMEEEFFCG